ncbi:hypothetical protein D3C86_1616690 [compost metagenome]
MFAKPVPFKFVVGNGLAHIGFCFLSVKERGNAGKGKVMVFFKQIIIGKDVFPLILLKTVLGNLCSGNIRIYISITYRTNSIKTIVV